MSEFNNLEFVENEPYEKGFSDFFQDKIKPKLIALEEKRLELLAKYARRKKIGYPLIILAAILIIGSPILVEWIPPAFVIGIIAEISAIMWMTAPLRNYVSTAKENLIPELLKFFGDFEYKINAGIEAKILFASKIFSASTSK